MIEQFIPLTKYFKEGVFVPSIKRILNFCFVLSTSSFLFTKLYFKYSLIDITDYKAQIEFIVSGHFFIPISIFFLVWSITNLFSKGVFLIFNHFISENIKSKILNFTIDHNKIIKNIRAASNDTQKIEQKQEWFVTIYNSIKPSILPKELALFYKRLEKSKSRIENDSVLLLRAFIATVVYFSTISYFGWTLLIILFFVFIILFSLLIIGFQFAELMPSILNKFIYEMENYIEAKK